MKTEPIVRCVAGSLILVSLLLAHAFGPAWLWLAAFVGANLFQSSLTSFCPLELILKRLRPGK